MVLEIYNHVLSIRKEKGLGQRSLKKEVKNKFKKDFSENTISGWIHRNIIPYANETTQFKPKTIPPEKELYELYEKRKVSAGRIAQKYLVSTIVVINWLKKYSIRLRTHKESMNTGNIKKELSELRLTKVTKNYKILTPEKAYILGVLCGEGYIGTNFLKLEIRRDIQFIKEFLRCIEEVYGIKYGFYYYSKRNSYISNITSKIICADLLSYGCFRTKEWDVPSLIINADKKKLISSFLRGLYDSEEYSHRYIISLTSVSAKAVQNTSRLLKKLEIDNRIKSYRNYFTINITNRKNLQKFKDIIGFTIKRKMDKLKW
ncbi:MAG: hypothetical protein KAK00_08630 [Nanoarchaeota archaeon]|nr:hypothetical protein [Nanoarchaeota archaeon]